MGVVVSRVWHPPWILMDFGCCRPFVAHRVYRHMHAWQLRIATGHGNWARQPMASRGPVLRASLLAGIGFDHRECGSCDSTASLASHPWLCATVALPRGCCTSYDSCSTRLPLYVELGEATRTHEHLETSTVLTSSREVCERSSGRLQGGIVVYLYGWFSAARTCSCTYLIDESNRGVDHVGMPACAQWHPPR